MQNWQANGTHNNAEINNQQKNHHHTNGQVQDNFNALPPPPPYTTNGDVKPEKVLQIKDVEKNGFELSRKDKKGFTTDAGGGALAMGGSSHGIQVNHRTS